MDDQNTEALLAAYIDGTLDADQRRMVEASLKKRPAHAEMVDQIRRARALVKGLPRESAPAGMSDEVLAQLERSALLEPSGMQIRGESRRPLALAAGVVLLLAGGLIAFVVFGLPEPNPIAATPGSDSQSAATANVPKERIPDEGEPLPPEPEIPSPAVIDRGDASPTSSTMPPVVPEDVGGQDAAEDVADEPRQDETDGPDFTREMFAEWATEGPTRIGGGRLPGWSIDLSQLPAVDSPRSVEPTTSPAETETILVVAETTDPAGVQSEVDRFARDHGLEIGDADAADGTLAVRMSRLQAAALAETLAETSSAVDRVTLLNADGAAGGVIEPGETLRVELIRRDDPTQAEAVDVKVDDDGTVQLFGSQFALGSAPLPAAGATEDELADRLERQLGGTDNAVQVNVRRRSAEPHKPVDADRLIRPGDRLAVSLGDVTENLIVGPDGTVKLPELDPIFASGFRPTELANLIDYHYRAGFVGAEPQVRVAFAEADAASQDGASPDPDEVVETIIVINPVSPGSTTAPALP